MQFGKRLKWRIWSWLAGTFGQNEIWSTRLSSSWKHPAVPYEVLIDPPSVPNPKILNMETNANHSGETHHRGGVKVSWLWCLVFPDAELNCSCGIFAGTDAQLVLMSSKSMNQRVSQILHSSTTNLQTQSATPDWAVNTTELHLGPLNLSCALGSARLTGYRPLLLSAFGYLWFTKQQKSRPYWFVPGTLRNWSQPMKLKPYRSPWGIWVNAASTVIKDWENDL